MKRNKFIKLYKNKEIASKIENNSKPNQVKGISNLTLTLITASATILNGIISTICVLHSINIQTAYNSFNFRDAQYVRRQKIADLIITEAGESENYLRDRWIECNSTSVKDKAKALHIVHKEVFHHLYKTIEYMNQYLATDSLSNLSDIEYSLRDAIASYTKNEILFEKCDAKSENIFSADKFTISRNNLEHSIWKDSERLQKLRDAQK